MNYLLVVLAVLGISGCASRGTAGQVPEGTPTALVKFGPVQGRDALTPYWYENDECKPSEYSGSLGSLSWLMGRETETRVTAEKPVYIYMNRVQSSATALYFCTAATKFTPISGATYQAEHTPMGEYCFTTVFEVKEDGSKIPVEQTPVKVTCDI